VRNRNPAIHTWPEPQRSGLKKKEQTPEKKTLGGRQSQTFTKKYKKKEGTKFESTPQGVLRESLGYPGTRCVKKNESAVLPKGKI